MLYFQEGHVRRKKSLAIFISADDIWKERVIQDAIRSGRKIKSRFIKFS